MDCPKELIQELLKRVIMNEIDFLKKEIRKTGYPLEIEISSLLEKKWKTVVNTDTYYDRDEGKLRDIDILAFDFLASDNVLPITLRTGLAIECKKDENFAWVFFTRPFELDMEYLEGQYVDRVHCMSKNTENNQILEKMYNKISLHYEDIERIAVAYDTFCLKGKKRSIAKKKRGIFEAQNQLKKYIDYTIDQLIKASPQFDVYPIEVYFPCIVFDGSMYEAILDSGRLKLKEAHHILLSSFYRSPYSVWEKGVLIDIVQKKYFKEYQKLIRKDVTSLRKTIRKYAKRFSREIDQMSSLLSSARAKV